MPDNATPAPSPSNPPIKRQSTAQQRAARAAVGPERQIQLKHEAAERRATRAAQEATSGPVVLGRISTQRRLNGR